MSENGKSFINDEDYIKNEIADNLKTLLTDHCQGIPLTALEDIYKTKFSKSLLTELIRFAFLDVLDKFASITPQNKENGSSDNIIALKGQQDLNQTQNQELQEITASGIVSEDFNYAPNPVTLNNDGPFLAYVSNINEHNHCIYMQPECHMEYMEKLTEDLDIYYSEPISENLLVKNVMIRLACVSKYEGVYHRVYIKENHVSSYTIAYVDLGVIQEVKQDEVQFKYLLNYFAGLPCMAIACRLVDVDFKLNNYRMPPEIYKELYALCQGGPFFVQLHNQVDGIFHAKIFDADHQCLNDVVVEKGLAFSSFSPLNTAMPPIISTLNHENHQKTQNTPSSVNSKQQSLNHVPQIEKTSKTSDLNLDDSMRDYIIDTSTETEIDDSSKPPNIKELKHNVPASNSSNKSGTRSDRKRVTDNKNSNQRNQRDSQNKENRTGFTVTIKRDLQGAGRIFNLARSSLVRNNPRNQRQVSNPPVSTTYQKRDESFANWMCSWAIEKSLWSSESYRNALLAYIGRIYGQRVHMYRLFTQLNKDMVNLDELDLLNQLILKTKQQRDAQTSLGKWEDDSRINRRLKDLSLVFEFNGDYALSNNPFVITPLGLRQIIARETIKSYFDLGCGDGVITAGIGAYLGLSKENILGGDVFEGQSKEITFVKVNESQSNIALSANCVDLITSFVTFHHLSQVKETLPELARILRPGGYLILREHDCKNDQSLSAKYLQFIHAIMMIARVGEFAETPGAHSCNSQHGSNGDYKDDINNWKEQKSRIIEYTKTIHYRTCAEWQKELESAGFRLCATLHYGANGTSNPQKLFYAVYQLDNK